MCTVVIYFCSDTLSDQTGNEYEKRLKNVRYDIDISCDPVCIM